MKPPSLSNTIIFLLLLACLVQTCRLEVQAPCPDVVPADTVVQVDTVEVPVPGPVVYRDTTIYRPSPSHQEPAREPVPQLISSYADTLELGGCEVVYDAQVLGLLQELNIKARRSSVQVVTRTETKLVEVERRVFPARFYVGGGIGAGKRFDDVSIEALYSTHKNAYSVGYDLIDQSVQAKIYFKLF